MFTMARTEKRTKEMAYRFYVADSLQGIPQGKYITRSFRESLVPRAEIDADAVIAHVQAALEA